jgi:hypothetical protein
MLLQLLLLLLLTLAVELHLGPVDGVWSHVNALLGLLWNWQLHIRLPCPNRSTHPHGTGDGACADTLAHSKPYLMQSSSIAFVSTLLPGVSRCRHISNAYLL